MTDRIPLRPPTRLAATPAQAPATLGRGLRHADYIAGLAKGLAVLESFDTERQRLNASQAAERAGLTRAAARRHLLTLTYLGYLDSDGQSFWLTPKVLRFSGNYLASARLPRVVQSTLNRLAAQTMQAYSVVVLDQNEVVIVARSASYRESERLLAYGLHLGARLPAHTTSTGRVLLAALPEQELQQWLHPGSLGQSQAWARLTAHTVTHAQQLETLIGQVRRDGYCLACEEHELGVQALAVPLRDVSGRTVAALNVVAAPRLISAERMLQQLHPLMQQAALELRSML
jgi:IclR family pca regulon transcriptional regulator